MVTGVQETGTHRLIFTCGAKRNAGIVVVRFSFFPNLLLLNERTEAQTAQTNMIAYTIWVTNSKSEVKFDL